MDGKGVSVMYSVYHMMPEGEVVEGTHRYTTLKSAETVAANVNATRTRQRASGIKWPSVLSYADQATED
jgi:hypothetical protein